MITQSFIKKEVYNILTVFDEFCRKHSISYVLGYGTLLGAVRHKGFIPWDDDIDVVLSSQEYYRLRKIALENPFLDDNQRYRFLIPGDKGYCYSFIKIIDTHYIIKEKNISDKYRIGLFIDVFRVDYWPKSPIVEFLELKSARLLLKINEVLIRGNIDPDSKFAVYDKLLKPFDLLLSFLHIDAEMICRKLEKKGANNKCNKYMGNIMSGSGKKTEKLPSYLFNNSILAEFEEGMFPIPKEYDEYLTYIYGNYMQLPDLSKQIGHEYEIEVVNNEK